MKSNKKGLSIVLFALVAVIVLGVGYATIQAINLTINGNATASADDANFTVAFTAKDETNSSNVTGMTYSGQLASFSTTGLTKEGDTAVAKYTITNSSPDLAANLTANSTVSNTEYFSVTQSLASDTLAHGESTVVTVTVTVLKTPIDADETADIVTTITATPNNN